MKDRDFYLLTVAIFAFLIGVFIYSFVYVNNKTARKVTDNYIAVFKGEKDGTIYSTYIYDISKNKDNNYRYIITETTSKSVKEKIISNGSVKSTKLLFDLAKSNNSYDYVFVKEKNAKLTISEFRDYIS